MQASEARLVHRIHNDNRLGNHEVARQKGEKQLEVSENVSQ